MEEVSGGLWQIGYKDGLVVLQFLGNEAWKNQTGHGEVAPAYYCWTPEQAREVSRLLNEAATQTETMTSERLHGCICPFGVLRGDCPRHGNLVP